MEPIAPYVESSKGLDGDYDGFGGDTKILDVQVAFDVSETVAETLVGSDVAVSDEEEARADCVTKLDSVLKVED